MLPGKKYGIEDVLRILWRRAWLILVPFAVVSAVTAMGARLLPDRYRSETLILVVPQRVPDTYVKSTVTARIEDRLESISQQILSRTRLERVINDFNLYATERSTSIMEDIVERMRRDITVQVVKGDSFRVSYSGANALTVMKVTERLASMFIEENLRDREVLAEGTSNFLEAQLEDARRRLIEQEKKIEQYRRRYSGQLPSQLQSNLQVIQNIHLQIQALTEALNRDRERRLVVERMVADSSAQTPDDVRASVTEGVGPESPLRGVTAAEQLQEARAILRAMEARLKPAHPDVARAKLLIAQLEQKVEAEAQAATPVQAAAAAMPPEARRATTSRAQELRVELEQLGREIARKEQQEQQLRAEAAEYQTRVDAVPSRESDLAELTRDYTTLQAMYTSLLTKKEDSKIAANLERRQIGEQFKLLDPARRPEKPFSPNRPLIMLIGMAGGLLIGVGLAALLEYRDTTFDTEQELTQALAISVLALLPPMSSAAERRRAFVRRLAVHCSLGALVIGSLGVVVYTFLR